MSETEFRKQVALARLRVGQMDESEGFRDRDPRTILFALEAGLRGDRDSGFDAYVMLEKLKNQ